MRSARRLCVTVDFETLDDEAVTIRDRDSTDQIRVPVTGLIDALSERLDELRPQVDAAPAGPHFA